jgi:hypothetical protein
VKALAAAVGAGLLLGIATQLLQGILPGALNWIANALSGWLVVAFLAGSRYASPRLAAVLGVVLLAAALAGYYATVQVRFGYGAGRSILLFWGIGALAGGLVFGAAGWWWRHGRERARALATGLLAALLVCEGVYFLAILPDPAVGAGAIGAGLAIPLVLGRTWRDRGLAYAGMLPGLAMGAAGYAVTLAVYGIVTAI